jgi:hypothetical protein
LPVVGVMTVMSNGCGIAMGKLGNGLHRYAHGSDGGARRPVQSALGGAFAASDGD